MSKIRAWIDRVFPMADVGLAPVVVPRKIKIGLDSMMRSSAPAQTIEIEAYKPPRGVVPDGADTSKMAMDFQSNYSYMDGVSFNGYMGFMGFMGYPQLSMLAQQPEYRKISGVIAEEMTREWIELVNTGDDDQTERIAGIHEALIRYNVRDLFREAAECDGFYGRGQIYIDMETPGKSKARDNPLELKTQLTVTPEKIVKGSLLGFKIIEPVWTYPAAYNSNNPLDPNFYKPDAWYVMGKQVHNSRLLSFVSRGVPDMLKPAYNFGGLSMSQLAKPYIDNWLRTRDAVSEVVHSFSVSGIKTDMSAPLAGGTESSIFDRAEFFTNMRDNKNVMLLDMKDEEFFQFNVPLSGLDALQAQAQEQMASVASIPLVKLLGITPAGLNASADPEIRAFYDYVSGLQENIFRKPLKTVIDIIQLSEFGDIDPDIGFKFIKLWQMSESDAAAIRKTDADADATRIASGIIMADEARGRLAADPSSGYDGLDMNVTVEVDEPDDDVLNEE